MAWVMADRGAGGGAGGASEARRRSAKPQSAAAAGRRGAGRPLAPLALPISSAPSGPAARPSLVCPTGRLAPVRSGGALVLVSALVSAGGGGVADRAPAS